MKYLESKFQELFSELNDEFGKIIFLYEYDEFEDQHYIYHDRSDLEFNKNFIQIVMNFLNVKFYDIGLMNIAFGYGKLRNENLFNYSFGWDDFVSIGKMKHVCKKDIPVIYVDEYGEKYIIDPVSKNLISLYNFDDFYKIHGLAV